MYNRYIPNGTAYTRVTERDSSPSTPPNSPSRPKPAPSPRHLPPPQKNRNPSYLSGFLNLLRLDDLDNGDILLILILLFLFRDGDDIELLITLALILLLGLGDQKENADR